MNAHPTSVDSTPMGNSVEVALGHGEVLEVGTLEEAAVGVALKRKISRLENNQTRATDIPTQIQGICFHDEH